ncbi:MAG: nucleotide exchange factor GrpE [Lachnospiraceae bacterium]|jgi:molecular chaperone GrpE|nr:nucleotide exchange factor GrpE [Lachnospiraceae bacterium]
MGREDRKKRAAAAAAEAEETVDLFRGEKQSAENDQLTEETVPDAVDAASEENSGEAPAEAKTDEPESANASEETEQKSEEAAGETATSGAEGKKKEPKKDKRDEKIAELSDKLLRQQAEFINFRNRTEKEKAQMFEVGAKSAFEKILPVIDNFERGLATLSEEEKAQPFAVGIDKTYKQLMTALNEAGVTPIEAVGQPFDPDLHNAVMHVEDESVGENVVVEEFQKGYKYRDSVLRHSMVKVAN